MAGKGTPAIAAAERAGIPFRVHDYAHDPRVASFGTEAVEKLGLDPARVFKTLVADVDGALTVAVVPVSSRSSTCGPSASGRAWPTRVTPSGRPAM